MEQLKISGSVINPATLGDAVAGPGMASATGVMRALQAQIKAEFQIAHGYDCVVGLAALQMTSANTDYQATFSLLSTKNLPTRASVNEMNAYVADTPRLMPVIASTARDSLTLNNCDAVDYFRYQAAILLGNTGSTDASATVTIGAYAADGTTLLELSRTQIVPAGGYAQFNFIDGGSSATLKYLKVKARSTGTGVRINNGSRINIHCENKGFTASDVFNE